MLHSALGQLIPIRRAVPPCDGLFLLLYIPVAAVGTLSVSFTLSTALGVKKRPGL